MTKKMLIDATHLEETRVALIDEQNRLIDFDFETTTKQTIKGNIYLARVARVEPSLQAAFIDFGGSRHGFLAFSEIHPDYFRIPVSDREALKETLQEASFNEGEEDRLSSSDLETPDASPSDVSDLSVDSLLEGEETDKDFRMPISVVGGETSLNDDEEILVQRRPHLHQKYKIQEVIQKNQILLVQVVKEERGGKGAAFTTFLSIAGRCSVLMPNSLRNGGVSRKIATPSDRLRLKKILEELDLPQGMGLIIRTAGRERTKSEIKRDAEFLMRAWNDIRELTLQSIAPALIYEEDDIIKRAIRDLYGKVIDEIRVDGEEGYKVARAFMKTLMPSHVKKVHNYKDPRISLFHKFKIEAQIDEMHNPIVYLPSGGSIVIHPTEALVSIDINSGRSTKGRHIKETALRTNLEAADEIARQVRLRDLAGLIVIDFIDMGDQDDIATVERTLKEAFRNDRARIQVGKIGPFGLLELSRQRLRLSLLETSTHPCPHCQATGYIRSTESTSLSVLRFIEEEALLGKAAHLQVHVPTAVAFYLLNAKREYLQGLESRLDVRIFIEGDDTLISPQYRMTCLKRRSSEEGGDEGAGGALKEALPQDDQPQEMAHNRSRVQRSLKRPAPFGEEKAFSTEEDENLEDKEASDTSEKTGSSRRRRSSRRRQKRYRETTSAGLPLKDVSPLSENDQEKPQIPKENQEMPLQELTQSSEDRFEKGGLNGRKRFRRNRRPGNKKEKRFPDETNAESLPSQEAHSFEGTEKTASLERKIHPTEGFEHQKNVAEFPVEHRSNSLSARGFEEPLISMDQAAEKSLNASGSGTGASKKKPKNRWWKKIMDTQ